EHLPSWTCPECGCDLRAVGIRGAASRRRSPAQPLMLWSGLVFLSAPVLSAALAASHLLDRHVYGVVAKFESPVSAQYVAVAATTQSWSSWHKAPPVALDLQ